MAMKAYLSSKMCCFIWGEILIGGEKAFFLPNRHPGLLWTGDLSVFIALPKRSWEVCEQSSESDCPSPKAPHKNESNLCLKLKDALETISSA